MDSALIAAGIAAAAADFAAVMAWVAAGQARRSSDRTHAWARIIWTVQTASDTEHDISESVLANMRDLRWAPEDDRELAARLLAQMRRRTYGLPIEGVPPC